MSQARSLLIALIVIATILPAGAFAGQKPSPPDLQAQISALAVRVSALEAQVNTLQTTLASDIALAPYVTVTTDARGPLALFSGLNIQLVNGTGQTEIANGLGNLIIGYDGVQSPPGPICSNGAYSDEVNCVQTGNTWGPSHKTGSHYLVVGDDHNYSQYGGIVVGLGNTSNGPYASVSGGAGNTASGGYASVSGGI